MRPLPASFYDRPVLDVARDLMGCRVVASAPDGEVTLRLTEVEAYAGTDDPGSHAFRGPTPRTEVMFGPPGHLYVYFSYGMHWCMNLVCGPAGMASAVLLRAGEVTGGLPVAQRRRPGVRDRDLARGPARLTKSLGIDGGWHGDAVTEDAGRLRVLPGNEFKEDAPPGAASATSISAGPRVGVSGAGGVAPWRFWLDGEPTVSPYRAAQPRRRRVPDSPP